MIKQILFQLLGFIIFITSCISAKQSVTVIEPTQQRLAVTPIYLPLVTTESRSFANNLVTPEDLIYLGAFRLPGGDDPPETFAYGGNAMTYNPEGDPQQRDGFPGSLFISGHDRIAYGGQPDGDQIAEVSIPEPAITHSLENLPIATFIQDFQNVTVGYFTEMEEIPKLGMQFLNHPLTGPLIHLAWGQHLQPMDQPTHAWFKPTLTVPDFKGVWYIGNQSNYSVNGYMFEIPASWADQYTGGRYLATGRFRDGGQGGMGPALFAYNPWLVDGSAPVTGTRLSEITLLLYEFSDRTEKIERTMSGYQHADEWEGGAWITTPSGKTAVLFTGTKSNGSKYWYGYRNPNGSNYVCVDGDVTDFPTCRQADGSVCPPDDFIECPGHTSDRGWWSSRFDAWIIFYDPVDLAKVASGQFEPYEPQPYAFLDIDNWLFLNPPEWDVPNVGEGDQRRYRIGDAAYDRENGLLYVLELLADGPKPVVHVWMIH